MRNHDAINADLDLVRTAPIFGLLEREYGGAVAIPDAVVRLLADVPALAAALAEQQRANERISSAWADVIQRQQRADNANFYDIQQATERAERAEAALAATQDEVDRRRPCVTCGHRASLHNVGYAGCSACDCGACVDPPVAIEVQR